MAFVIRRKNGKNVTLLNPQEKKEKAFNELKHDLHLTNDGEVKLDENGAGYGLTKNERAYRAGLISGIRICQKANSKKKKK